MNLQVLLPPAPNHSLNRLLGTPLPSPRTASICFFYRNDFDDQQVLAVRLVPVSAQLACPCSCPLVLLSIQSIYQGATVLRNISLK